MLNEYEFRGSIRIEIPNTGDRIITEDDFRTMVSNALGHGHCGTGVQLILHDVAQEDEHEEPIICNTYVDIDWDSIEEV